MYKKIAEEKGFEVNIVPASGSVEALRLHFIEIIDVSLLAAI